jgi:hypothetical protein
MMGFLVRILGKRRKDAAFGEQQKPRQRAIFRALLASKSGVKEEGNLRLRTGLFETAKGTQASGLAAPDARALHHPRTLEIEEGAGNAGCALHPRSRAQYCGKEAHTSIQVQRRQSGIPCAMAYGLYTLSPVSGLDSHRRLATHRCKA